MFLIVGLGNISRRYELTRHNVGFMAIDVLVEHLDAKLVKNSIHLFKGKLYRKSEFLLLKPSTYMNLSGISVKSVLKRFNISRLIVIHDDVDMKFGCLKFKFASSSGGHRGVLSINENVFFNYFRIKVGIGRPANTTDISEYVLEKFKKDEIECLYRILDIIKVASLELCSSNIEAVSSKYTIRKSIY